MLFETHDNSKKSIETCPYCKGKNFIKRGRRRKKHESVQIYYCKKCEKKFMLAISKNKTFPLRLILDALTLYNRLYTLEESAEKVSEKYGIKMSCQNIRNWLKNFAEYLPFLRMRKIISNKYNKRSAFIESKMFHNQIYHFKYHKAKTDLIQIRNGMIYIMDYKPNAKKVKPIEQLMIYALALSRLTCLRLYHFKCAWFDDEDYFEFYPLHVVYKKKQKSTFSF